MLDDEYGVATVNEPVQDAEQHADVLEVQARRRLVEDVERPTGVALRQFRRQLDPLRLATGQGRRRLAEVDVAEPDIEKGLQLLADARLILEEGERVLDRLLEHVGDAQSPEADFERLTIVALPLADVARHIDVGQKVHLEFDETIALARLASSAFDVE